MLPVCHYEWLAQHLLYECMLAGIGVAIASTGEELCSDACCGACHAPQSWHQRCKKKMSTCTTYICRRHAGAAEELIADILCLHPYVDLPC